MHVRTHEIIGTMNSIMHIWNLNFYTLNKKYGPYITKYLFTPIQLFIISYNTHMHNAL